MGQDGGLGAVGGQRSHDLGGVGDVAHGRGADHGGGENSGDGELHLVDLILGLFCWLVWVEVWYYGIRRRPGLDKLVCCAVVVL